ncbi:MAG TPA: chloride channel protein [Thermoanaerobaculia bacterium]
MTKISRRVLLLMFIAAGIVSGLAAVLFHEWIVLSRSLLLERALRIDGPLRPLLLISIPATTAALLGYIVQRFAPSTLGAGLARVRRSYEQDVKYLDPRTVIFTFLLTPLSLGSGAPLGPEGPTVVVTSGLSVWVARVLGFPRKVLRGMVPVGTAAGIAAIFRTPITGVVFALEELFGTSSRSILGGTLIAAVAAAVVQQALGGSVRILPAGVATWNNTWELLGFAIVGVTAGIVSGTVLRVAAVMRDRLRTKIPSVPLRFGLGGAAVGLLGVFSPSMLGVGYETTSLLLRGGGSLMFDAEAFGAKTLGFMIAASAGLLGGTFAPSLFIGAALGGMIGHAGNLIAVNPIDTGAYALVGMGAYFAGTLRAPIAAVLIVIELTNDYGLVIPLMLGVAISNAISHAITPRSLEEDQLEKEGYRPPRDVRDPLGQLVVRQVMSTEVMAFEPDTPLVDVLERTREKRHAVYPVMDSEKRLMGLLSGDAVGRAVRLQQFETTVEDLMDPPLIAARESESLNDLLGRMSSTGVDRCPVVDSQGVVVGFLSPSDVVRARFQHQSVISDEMLD